MRKLLAALVLLLGFWFLISRFSELRNILRTFQSGNIVFIGLAFLVQLVYMANVALSFLKIYRATGLQGNLAYLLQLTAAANLTNVVAPSGGASYIAVFVMDAKRSGNSPARVTVVYALYMLFEYFGLLSVLVIGLAVLSRRNNLHWAEISASFILLVIAMGMLALLYAAMRSGNMLGRVLAFSARVINRLLRPFLKRAYLDEERAHSFAAEAATGIALLRKNPRRMVPIMLLALSSKALLIAIFILIFNAFGVEWSGGTIIAAFSICELFVIVSPTPSGIGLVEGVLTLTLNSLFIPLEASAIITIAYRGVTFWFPLLLGFFAFRGLNLQNRLESAV